MMPGHDLAGGWKFHEISRDWILRYYSSKVNINSPLNSRLIYNQNTNVPYLVSGGARWPEKLQVEVFLFLFIQGSYFLKRYKFTRDVVCIFYPHAFCYRLSQSRFSAPVQPCPPILNNLRFRLLHSCPPAQQVYRHNLRLCYI